MKPQGKTIVVNGRNYNAPERPTVVICLDGSEPGYIEKAIEAGVAPTFARFMRDGAHVHANSVIPSFTNPNNLSIITGRRTSLLSRRLCGARQMRRPAWLTFTTRLQFF